MRYILVIFVLLFSGCTTALWGPNYSEVKINGFYINKSTNDLIVTTTDSNAFIFPIDDNLSSTMTEDFILEPYFQGFSINSSGQVAGTLQLYERVPELTEMQKLRLTELGFVQKYKTGSYSLERQLNGRMFTIEGELPFEPTPVEYSVMISQPSTAIENIGKLLATPVTIAYDAVVVVPTVLVMATVMAAGGK